MFDPDAVHDKKCQDLLDGEITKREIEQNRKDQWASWQRYSNFLNSPAHQAELNSALKHYNFKGINKTI